MHSRQRHALQSSFKYLVEKGLSITATGEINKDCILNYLVGEKCEHIPICLIPAYLDESVSQIVFGLLSYLLDVGWGETALKRFLTFINHCYYIFSICFAAPSIFLKLD